MGPRGTPFFFFQGLGTNRGVRAGRDARGFEDWSARRVEDGRDLSGRLIGAKRKSFGFSKFCVYDSKKRGLGPPPSHEKVRFLVGPALSAYPSPGMTLSSLAAVDSSGTPPGSYDESVDTAAVRRCAYARRRRKRPRSSPTPDATTGGHLYLHIELLEKMTISAFQRPPFPFPKNDVRREVCPPVRNKRDNFPKI